MNRAWTAYRLLVWKDIRTEFRRKHFLISTIAYGILLLLIIGIALDAASRLAPDLAAGILWTCVLFTISVSMNRYDVKDTEMEARFGMLLAPIDRSLLFYAKWTSTAFFVTFSNIVLSVLFFVILNEPAPRLWGIFFITLLLGSVGLTGIGSFLASLASLSSMRDILLPILLFPIAVPLLLGLIRMTVYAFEPGHFPPIIWYEVLGAYLLVFAILPWLLYEPMMEV